MDEHHDYLKLKPVMNGFLEYLKRKDLKLTNQRKAILLTFWACEGHLSPEELYAQVQTKNPHIGQATVYRTLKLLVDAGLAKEVHFTKDSPILYERVLDRSHHDHLICESCGLNMEVMDPQIERLQEELAEKHGFRLTGHRMNLYGLCPSCR